MKLKRKRVGDPIDRHYNLYDRATGRLIADAVMTGEWGRDNYPWDWSFAPGVDWDKSKMPENLAKNIRSMGSLSTLTEVVDYVESNAAHFGLKFED